jgi:hypothetical protein
MVPRLTFIRRPEDEESHRLALCTSPEDAIAMIRKHFGDEVNEIKYWDGEKDGDTCITPTLWSAGESGESWESTLAEALQIRYQVIAMSNNGVGLSFVEDSI